MILNEIYQPSKPPINNRASLWMSAIMNVPLNDGEEKMALGNNY